tara:strand:+ start:538 stop:1074 length:537 start_codon:yes stop_codon:yes gene_type:complete
MVCGCAWYDVICHAECGYHKVANSKVGKAIGKVATTVGKGVSSAVSTVGKVVNTVASPLVKAVEYVGEKTGLDKPVKAIVGTVAKGVRAVGSAIEDSGVVGQALADAYNLTKVVNPVAKAIDTGLAGADVIEGKTKLGTALVAVGVGNKLKKMKGGKKLLDAGTFGKSAQHVKRRHSD